MKKSVLFTSVLRQSQHAFSNVHGSLGNGNPHTGSLVSFFSGNTSFLAAGVTLKHEHAAVGVSGSPQKLLSGGQNGGPGSGSESESEFDEAVGFDTAYYINLDKCVLCLCMCACV
jgi:hypothetical protein